MRAMTMSQSGDAGVLELTELARPIRTNAEVLVRVVAAGVNPIDVKTRAGRGGFPAIQSFPVVLGNDFSGVVVEAPYEAHPLQPGTEVYGMTTVPRVQGAYAEYLSVSELSLVRKPATLSHVEAAAVPLAALTAWGMVVETARAHEGQRMLIHAGAGGVGHFAVQFASYFGAHVIATGSAQNADWLRSLGAAEVIDYTAVRFEEELAPVDAVIDLIGNVSDDTATRSLKVLRPGGIIVNAPTGSWPTLAEDCEAAGVRGTGYRVSPNGATLAVISRLLDSGDVRVAVEQVFDLAEAPAAHRQIESGHTRGKIVLHVAEN
ncbi:MAG: NADPH:quinone reductase [Leifsonia sp.]|nr:NADP-dependent oxidoreductase [Microbacterium sp. UBA1612]MAT19381.1 NADPH:quinone reductase [Leifsonia sp.]|tara:strand:- start:30981 stop:31937 length:957 start_codon:yes stop_codon:yes gene_type:complete